MTPVDTVRSLNLDLATGSRSIETPILTHPESTILYLSNSIFLDPKSLLVFAKGPAMFRLSE
jgi:hypothetical protein